MKKLFTVLLIVGVLLTLSVSFASANGGPHGGYTATTDACAGCHRAHTATSANLLIQADTTTLCLTCHGTAGTGADTNVDDGYFLSTRSPSTEGTANTIDNANLLGGGFVNQGGAAVTSTHAADGSMSNAWGFGALRGAYGALAAGESLDCASCHDPHGSTNYRIIPTTVNGVATTVTQVDEGAKSYDTETWAANVSNVCVACHTAYHDNAATTTHNVDVAFNAGINSGADNPETVGFGGENLPLAGTTLVCQTCHFPHGSSSVQTVLAEGATLSGLTDGSAVDSSALLRLDNRGVCEVCHQK
jgi:predicted CXXCH cytochrome family protein